MIVPRRRVTVLEVVVILFLVGVLTLLMAMRLLGKLLRAGRRLPHANEHPEETDGV